MGLLEVLSRVSNKLFHILNCLAEKHCPSWDLHSRRIGLVRTQKLTKCKISVIGKRTTRNQMWAKGVLRDVVGTFHSHTIHICQASWNAK